MALSLMLSLVMSLAQDKPAEPKTEMPKAEAPKQEKSPVDVWFEDGIRFKSKDGNFEGRLGGRYLVHYRTIFDRPEDTAAPLRDLPNTFFTRQARIDLEGTIMKDWGFKVQVDFGSGITNQPAGTAASNVSGTLRDGFVEWKRWKEFQIRFGQFFEPLSQEDISSTRFIDFAERSPMNRLFPGREIGIQFAGALMSNELTYAVMLCNGNALLNDGGRAVNDGNDQKEVGGYLRYSPFLNGDSFLKGLRLGLAGSYGQVQNVSAAGMDLITTELSVLWAEATAGTFDDYRGRLSPQLSYTCGPFALRGEYVYRVDKLASNALLPDKLHTKGWYMYATYILTGENKVVENRIVPTGDWGAVELAFRVSRVHIEDAVASGIFAANPPNADTATSFTLGVNWWVTRNVRFTLNFVREKFDERLGFDTEQRSMLMGAILRAQIDF
jgi:phosphate-selective porin OprO and OprP